MGRSPLALPDELVAWVEQVGGGRLARADRIPGGARKEAWFVTLDGPDGEADLFLRYDRTDPAETKDPWTLHREASVYLALADTPVPVPKVLAVHPELQAMVSERVRGENWFSRITDPGEQVATARDFMARLADLHAVDATTLDLPALGVATTAADAVRRELAELTALLAARGGEPDPALVFTLDWLGRHIPAPDGPVVLVQGDTGPGNFMFEAGRVVAIVDWELAHFGDPMDDIAWLTLRATQEPFPDLPLRLREYEERSGHAIDQERVRYYQVMAEAKLQVMSHGAGAGGGGDVGNGFIYGVLHRRLWLEALGAAAGIAPPPPAPWPLARAGERSWMFDAVLGELREVIVPRTEDPLARARAKGVARLVKVLQQADAFGAFVEEAELADLAQLLGHRPVSVGAGRAAAADAVRSGQVPDADYITFLWRRVARENELARPAMGALADRHWPALA